MANRVLIDPSSRSGLRVSLAGYDVLSSSREYMAFDGAFRQLYRYASGVLSGRTSNILVSGVPRYGTAALTAYFGEVLPFIPLCKFHWGYTSIGGNGSGFTDDASQNPRTSGAWADVTQSYVTFNISGSPNLAVWVYFILLRA